MYSVFILWPQSAFLFLVLTYLFTSLGSRWPLAVSNMQIPSTLKGKMCHHSTNLSGCMLTHSNSGSQNILAAEPFLFPLESFKEAQFVRQIKAECLCLKHEWEA